jgi:8-oxo-dGTP diphosphatase
MAHVDLVLAAGGVVWRRAADDGSDEPETLLVHRPKYDDWSFPKGKCDPGEGDAECALREVEEETGFVCRLGDELPSTEYRDPKGRPKRVRYWSMTVESGRFTPNNEIDEIRWRRLSDATGELSYDHDRTVLAALADRLGAPRA